MEHVGETRGRNVHPASSLDATLPEAGLFVGAAPPLGAGDAEAWPVARVHVELAARPLPLLRLRLLLLAAAGAVICGDERRIKIESIGRSAGTAAEANSNEGGIRTRISTWGWVDVGGERGLLVVVRRRLLGDATSGLGSGGGSSGGVRLLLTVEGLHVASAAPRHGSGDLSPADGAGLVVEDDGNGLECGSKGVGLVDLD